MDKIEPAERVREPKLPSAQYAKGIDVDDRTYLPGEGLHDWAEEFFYSDTGGEG
jgi:hypothetical protein